MPDLPDDAEFAGECILLPVGSANNNDDHAYFSRLDLSRFAACGLADRQSRKCPMAGQAEPGGPLRNVS